MMQNRREKEFAKYFTVGVFNNITTRSSESSDDVTVPLVDDDVSAAEEIFIPQLLVKD